MDSSLALEQSGEHAIATSLHIDTEGRLNPDSDPLFTQECPHCHVLAHFSPMAVPRFELLTRNRPKQIGVVFRCESCNAPRFVKFQVKAYDESRIELSRAYIELETVKEKFQLGYLPEATELLFREALTCYSNGCFNAFASMCRRTAQSIFEDRGSSGKLAAFDQFAQVKDLARVDDETFDLLQRIVFDSDGDHEPNMPQIGASQAGVLLEAMKDLLYQAYVRQGRLQQAISMRRHFRADGDAA